MSVTTQIQDITSKKIDLKDADNQPRRFGCNMVSNDDGSILWAVDLNQYDDDKKGAYIHIFTVTGGSEPHQTGIIHLPAVTTSNTTWKTSDRKQLTVTVSQLRRHAGYIWAADYDNGTIYRVAETATSGDAEIIFFKPTLDTDAPLQFNDIAFQDKAAGAPYDRLWVANAGKNFSHIYSIDLTSGFSGSYVTPVDSIKETTDLKTVLKGNPVEFTEMLFANGILWILCIDSNDPINPEKCGLAYGIAKSDGSLDSAKFMPVNNASTMVANLIPGKETLYIGARDGALYRKNIGAGNADMSAMRLHNTIPTFAHQSMSLDKAGYIWSANVQNGMINCYSPQGTLSRQYHVKPITAVWISPASLQDGKHVAVVDTTSPSIGVFPVDDAFILGDFDLKFDQASLTVDVSEKVGTLPLAAYKHGSTDKYPRPVSAVLTEEDKDDNNNGKTFPLTPDDNAVDIPAGAPNVTLNSQVTAGANEGNAKMTAEARTTGNNATSLPISVRKKPVIKPDPDDKTNNHANLSGGFDIRQGRDISLPDVKIESGSGDGTLTIANSEGTFAKFTGKPDKNDTDTRQKVADANGKQIPDINGGEKVGTASVKVSVGGSDSKPVAMHILPLADSIGSSKQNTGTNPNLVIEAINKQMKLITQGHAILNNNTSSVLPAPKTLIQIKLVTEPAGAVQLIDNGRPQDANGVVTRLSDDKGEVTFTQGYLQVAYANGRSTFDPRNSHFEVQYDTSGQMSALGTPVWSAAVRVILPIKQ